MSLLIVLIATSLASHAVLAVHDTTYQCGHRPVVDQLVGRVVGGRNSFYGQVPWQALIKESRMFGLFVFRKCGAVLISDRWAITAAHCSAGWLGSLVVVLGEHDIGSENDASPIERKVRRIVVHPEFDRVRLENDIALVELDSAVTFSRNVQPICLPRANDDFADQSAFVSGWGRTDYSELIASHCVATGAIECRLRDA